MNKTKRKKLALFKLFSQNLEWIKEHPDIKFEPDFSHGYVCPLCFDIFFEKDLDSALPNYLTFEDIPPASLGGKVLALSCKSCNSTSGHKLDAHLLNTLLQTDALKFLPNSKAEATFELNGNKMNGVIERNEKGALKLDLQLKRSNPNHSKQFMKDLLPKIKIFNPHFNPDMLLGMKDKTLTFEIQLKETSNERRAEVALLRIGYLIAYAALGNGFFINGGLYKVREQILNPDKEILPRVFWLKIPFPKESEGVNIITLPKELQSFLVVFNLETASQSRQVAIVLPGPSSPGIEVYDFIEKELCIGNGTKFCNVWYEHINARDFLREKKLAFAGNWCWQEYTKDEYKPRKRSENIE